MERLDGYVRVSRVAGRDGPSYISPSVQREAIERWASYKTVQIDEWHVDEDWSGGASSRPGLDRAVDRAVSGQTGGIVSWKIDRFSRLTEQGLRDLRRLNEVGARLAFVVEDIDTSSPIGRMVYTIMLAQAEYFLEQTKASWITAKRRAVDRGAFIGPTPIGYRRRDDATLEPDPAFGPVVSEGYRLAARSSLQAAAEHFRRRIPGRRWTAATVRRVLASRVYLGETRNGSMVQAGTHVALTDRATWEAAQSAPSERLPAEAFPLSGLLRCATCEGPMIGGRGGIGQRTYRCAQTLSGTVRAGAKCPQGATVTAERVEAYVRSQIAVVVAGMRVVVTAPEPDGLDRLERGVDDAEMELDAFAADLTVRRALGDRYHAHLQSRVDAVARARAEYRVAARRASEVEAFDVDAMLAGDPEALVVGLRSIFDSIVVRPGRGLAVEDKVRLVPFDADEASGVPGLE